MNKLVVRKRIRGCIFISFFLFVFNSIFFVDYGVVNKSPFFPLPTLECCSFFQDHQLSPETTNSCGFTCEQIDVNE